MARMEAELEIDQGRAVVTLGGALDVSNAHRFGALLRRLVQEGCTEIVVDLGTAASIDASGIGILRGAANAVRRRCDGRLHFRNAPIDLASILTDCGLVESRADEGETAAAGAEASSRTAAAVASSAGKNDSIASSSTVTSRGAPNTVIVLKNDSSMPPSRRTRIGSTTPVGTPPVLASAAATPS
jgi:anti-anti-sigma factor